MVRNAVHDALSNALTTGTAFQRVASRNDPGRHTRLRVRRCHSAALLYRQCCEHYQQNGNYSCVVVVALVVENGVINRRNCGEGKRTARNIGKQLRNGVPHVALSGSLSGLYRRSNPIQFRI